MTFATYYQILAYLTVFIALPLTWYVTVILWRVSNESPDIPILRERAVAALSVAVIVTVFGLIFLNNDAPTPPISAEWTKLITRTTVLVATVVPSMYWLWLYRR